MDYAAAAAAGIQFVSGQDRDIRYAAPSDKATAPIIRAVINEQKRLEGIPDRKNPYTLPMLYQAQADARAAGSSRSAFLGKTHAFADWSQLLVYVGARLSEWAQPDDRYRPADQPY